MTDKSHPDSAAADAAEAAGPPSTRRRRGDSVTQAGDSSPATSSAPSLAPGTLLGPYRLLEKLGQGGMGAVYKAQHAHLDKTVAVKVLPAHFTADADAVARFKREMKAVGKVTHPNIVQAHDAGEIDGTHFLAMEFVPGRDLNQLVKDRGKLPVDKACKIIRQAALGLAAAHAAGLVHRDVKPANLLVTKTGQIKLLDLGLAILATDKVNQTSDLTAAGQTLGTPDYMAPEQWEDAHGVDGRCDLYALGCTLCFLLTGRAPFATADTASIFKKLNAHTTKPPPDLRTLVPGIPDGLAALFEKLMAKRPEDRPPTATALAEALLPFTTGQPGSAPATVPTVPNVKTSQPQRGEALVETFPRFEAVYQKPESKTTPPRTPKWLLPVAGGAGALLLLGVIIITITSKDGTQTTIRVREGTSTDIKTAPGSKVTITQSSDTTSATGGSARLPAPSASSPAAFRTPDHAQERAVAEWVLSMGGTVSVVDAAGVTRSLTKAPLPDEPFVVSVVDLNGNQRVTDADLSRLSALSKLQHLVLNNCPQITDAGMPALAQIPSLELIYLQSVALTDAGLAHLVRLPKLHVLALQYTRVTDQGMKLLAQSSNLQDLYLSGLPVTIEGLRGLHGLPIKHLSLSGSPDLPGSQLKYADLLELVKIFPALQSFGYRELLGEVGAGLSPLAGLPELEYLAAAAGDIAAGPPHHLERFPALRTLGVHFNAFPKGLAARLEQLPHVTRLSIVEPRFENAAFDELSANTTLQFLQFQWWSGGDTELLQLAGMKRLRELNLVATKVTAAGAQEFHKRRPDVAITGDFNIPADPSTQAAKERAVAEWVLSVGGKVHITDAAGVMQTVVNAPLPQSPFTVSGVHIIGNQQLTDADLSRLVPLTALSEVILHLNPKVGDAGIATLAQIPTLQTLDVESTGMTDAGLRHLGALPRLTYLDAADTSVTIEGLRSLNGLPLSFLDIGGTRIKYSDLHEIVELFPRITQFDSRNVQGDVGAGLSPLAEMAHLNYLIIEASDVVTGPPHHLERFPALRTLSINYEPFPQRTAARLEHLTGITALRLEGVTIESAALKELGANRTLERLDLQFFALEDAQLAQLSGMKNLRELNLLGTQVTAAGAQEFHKRRPDVAITGDFNIPADPSIQAAREREAAEWLLSIKAGFHVRDRAGVERVVHTAADLPAEPYVVLRVYLHGLADAVTDAGLANLRGLTELAYLDLSGCGKVTDAGVAYLADCATLLYLDLAFTAVTDGCAGSLSTLLNLRHLNLGETQVGDAGFEQIGRALLGLEWVRVGRPTSEGGLRHLLPAQYLTDLEVNQEHVTEATARLLKQMPRLAGFAVGGATDTEVARITKLSGLRRLTLSNSRITPPAMDHLARFPELLHLNLGDSSGVADDHLKAVAQLTRLRELYLHGTAVTDAGLKHLHEMRTLTVISLVRAKVTKTGVDELHTALPGCKLHWDGGVIEPTIAADRRAAK